MSAPRPVLALFARRLGNGRLSRRRAGLRLSPRARWRASVRASLPSLPPGLRVCVRAAAGVWGVRRASGLGALLVWGRSSVGRAAALQAAGHRFEPVRLHHGGWARSSGGQSVRLISVRSPVRVWPGPPRRGGTPPRRGGTKTVFCCLDIVLLFRHCEDASFYGYDQVWASGGVHT